MGQIFSTIYPARDGLQIPAFVTLPPGYSSLDEAKGLPFIVMPRGGPNARTYAGFDWEVQFLVSRGYAVLQMNFRGSTGYGQEFVNAGDRQWGQAMQDDITDGTQWLVEKGYAVQDNIAIMGASYGGYAALMGLIKTPDTYQCAVVHGAVTDLQRLLQQADKYVGGQYATRSIGRLWSSDGPMLRDNSPAKQAEAITAPVLIFHSEKDRVVNIEQAKMMKGALSRKKKEFEFITLPNGTHYLDVGNNRLTYLSKTEEFLKGCLK